MNRRHFLVATAVGLCLAGPASAQSEQAAQALVRQVSDEMLTLIRSPADDAAKRQAFVAMMDRYSDMRQIAGFALGRYARTMPETLKPRYIEAFKQFVAATYVPRFAEYSGETIEVGQVRPKQNGYVVETTINRGAQPPYAVNWQISDRSGQPQVEDFIFEGISMAMSQRGEFASLIDSYGGNLEQFVQYLEARG